MPKNIDFEKTKNMPNISHHLLQAIEYSEKEKVEDIVFTSPLLFSDSDLILKNCRSLGIGRFFIIEPTGAFSDDICRSIINAFDYAGCLIEETNYNIAVYEDNKKTIAEKKAFVVKIPSTLK